MKGSSKAPAPKGMWCPPWHTRKRGRATVYEFGDVVIEAETQAGKEKICRVGSELIHVPFTEIDDSSEVWKVGETGTLKVNRAGFERIIGGFLKPLKVAGS